MVEDTLNPQSGDAQTTEDAEPVAPEVDPVAEDEDEYIVIPRWLLVTVGVSLLTFIVGAALGYVLAITAFQRGVTEAAAEVLAAMGDASQRPAAQAAAPRPTQPPERLDNVSVDDDPYLGPEDAPITIVEFSDFRCPYCKRFHDETMPELLEAYEGQIRFVYRDFPVVGGEAAAEASQCAHEQGQYWDYHHALFENIDTIAGTAGFVELAESMGMDGDQFQQCMDDSTYRDEVVNDYNDARAYGVTGTPTFFINGVRIVGAQPLASFVTVIDEELENQ